MKRFLLSAFIVLFAVLVTNAYSQFSDIKISGGLVTTKILGDNPASKPIIERDTSKPFIIGGSYDVPQNGIFLNFDFALDENQDLIIPVGIEYNFFRSSERIPVTKYVTYLYSNDYDIFSPYLGFKYKFFKFPVANAKAYVEVMFTANFIGSSDFTLHERRYNDSDTTLVFPSKEAVTRFGGRIKIGFEGEIISPVFVDSGISWGAMNFLGRDETHPDDGGRGELLTPLTNFETGESLVQTLNIYLGIKYKL